jgi:hypothetical protein
VQDDGEGASAHLRRGLGLADDFEAISALTKGKQTTWPERHTGEGVFFTSKMNDLYQIQANSKQWTADNLRADQAVGTSSVKRGTVVYGQVAVRTTTTPTQVFEQYVDDEFAFSKTRPSVKVAVLGMHFASRSEARRLIAGLDEFTEIDLDFGGVPAVGRFHRRGVPCVGAAESRQGDSCDQHERGGRTHGEARSAQPALRCGINSRLPLAGSRHGRAGAERGHALNGGLQRPPSLLARQRHGDERSGGGGKSPAHRISASCMAWSMRSRICRRSLVCRATRCSRSVLPVGRRRAPP